MSEYREENGRSEKMAKMKQQIHQKQITRRVWEQRQPFLLFLLQLSIPLG